MEARTDAQLIEDLRSLEADRASGKLNPVLRVAITSQVKKLRAELAIRRAAQLGKVA